MIVDPKSIIETGMAYLPAKFDSVRARTMLYAIGLQESGFDARRQYGNGPAAGFWQFERGGGVTGVLRHPASGQHARMVCMKMNVVPEPLTIWMALQENDNLAVCFARLLLWTDASPLPANTQASADSAWAYYQRNWRPGKPNPKAWPAHWRAACDAYKGDDRA